MEAGSTIAGKYRLNRPIGSGGMAQVWSATNIFTEREFAIKFLLAQVARSQEAVRRFLLEAKVSARVNHPNIIEIIDVGQAEDGSLFLVMELLAGVSLETAIRRQRPPMLIKDFLGIMHDVARAIAAAHRSGVIHRDLKPSNVYLHRDREGNTFPKILDFGVSKILEDEQNHALTIAGTVLGSPLYMSPEQAMGSVNIDGRTDIFAFGSILFEAFSGFRAYDAPNFNALIVTIATTEPKKIDDAAPYLPESLRALVRDCMKTDRRERIANFDLVAERLERVVAELGGSPLRLPAPPGAALDPEATAAMPVSRPGAELGAASSPGTASAPPNAGTLPPSMSANAPPGAFSSPWGTPSPGFAAQGTRRTVIALLASASVVILLLLVAIALTVAKGAEKRASAVAPVLPTAAQATEAPSASPAESSSEEPPVVSIESLPFAGVSSHTGRLIVSSGPGSCVVTVDGKTEGPTPVTANDVPSGTHKVECAVAGGKTRSTTVTIGDGRTERYRFNLGDL
jgi:eukaryotic-like serine/threonine-protein kinase